MSFVAPGACFGGGCGDAGAVAVMIWEVSASLDVLCGFEVLCPGQIIVLIF